MSFSEFIKPVQKIAYSHVGNFSDPDENKQYVASQMDLLNRQDQRSIVEIPEHLGTTTHTDVTGSLRYGVNVASGGGKKYVDAYHQFNPYYDFIKKKGLLKEKFKTRINTTYINIDSSARTVEPRMITTDDVKLDSNPLSFATIDITVGINSSKQNILVVDYPDHSLNKNDRITITGIEKTTVLIKNIYTLVTESGSETKTAIVFTPGSYYVTFICNYDTNEEQSSMSFDPNFKVGNGVTKDYLSSYDTSDMFVNLSGFDISKLSGGSPYIGNIPINFLNSTHQIYFMTTDRLVKNLINVPNGVNIVQKITGFYIKLPIPFNGLPPSEVMTITMTFNYIGGIPLNNLNAEFPIDEERLYGYHQVYSTTADTISILLNKDTAYKDKSNDLTGINQSKFGGDNVYIAKITDLISGYSNPNKYKIELPSVLHDVVMVKLISTSFPNTAKVFNNNTDSKNTALYWQNQDDGADPYRIEIEPGNYDPSVLEKLIEAKVYEVKRNYSKIANTSTSYTDRNFMDVSIDINTNVVTIKSYKEAKLTKPIQTIAPEPPKTGDGASSYTLTIFQSSHGLQVGDNVLFTGLSSASGIPDTVLNTTHSVIAVPTNDTYNIKVENFNLNASRTDTAGGFAAKAYVPSKFRLLFDYPDTMGEQLGFRKVGKSIAVTKFSTVVSNQDEYQEETVIVSTDGTKYILDESGNQTRLTSNALKFCGTDYILMMVREFANMINISSKQTLKSCFAKINLTGLPGKLIYDTFVSAPITFYDPIDISELNISFYSADEQLFDFNGIDHSFVLEITSIDYMPDDTGIITTNTVL
jgi:hypothetical protein